MTRLFLTLSFGLALSPAHAEPGASDWPMFLPASAAVKAALPAAPEAAGAYPGRAGSEAAEREISDESDATNVCTTAFPRGAGFPGAPTTSGGANPALALTLNGASTIGDDEARTILTGMGLLRPGAKLSTGLRALHYTHTYTFGKKRPPSDDVTLTDVEQQWLFDDYGQLVRALRAYPDTPVVDDSNPHYAEWVQRASAALTHVPAAKRRALLEALLHQETTKLHWREYRPIQSPVGATGFSQLLAKTANDVGANRFDPAENLMGSARFLDDLVAQKGLTGGLVYYNGGANAPTSSYGYAHAIEMRAGLAPTKRKR